MARSRPTPRGTPRPRSGRWPAFDPFAVDLRRADLALLLLRVVVGVVFIAHGAQKLFVYGLPAVTDAMAGFGIPWPGFAGPLVAFVEFIGGIALVVGLFARIAALAFVVEMLVATLWVHLPNGFFLPKGYEFTLTLLGAALALLAAGAGRYSLDGAISSRRFTSRRA